MIASMMICTWPPLIGLKAITRNRHMTSSMLNPHTKCIQHQSKINWILVRRRKQPGGHFSSVLIAYIYLREYALDYCLVIWSLAFFYCIIPTSSSVHEYKVWGPYWVNNIRIVFFNRSLCRLCYIQNCLWWIGLGSCKESEEGRNLIQLDSLDERMGTVNLYTLSKAVVDITQ